jgi:uncharacterized protein (DUF169 family)
MGLFESADAASKTVSDVPKIDPGTIQATFVFPLEKAPVNPDIVILFMKPIQVLWTALSLLYIKGGKISSSFAGIGEFCGYATAIPYLENVPNFTMGGFGSRKQKAPEEMLVGIPAPLLEEVVSNVEKLSFYI